MNIFSMLARGVGALFGLGGATTPSGKSIITETADVYDRIKPSPVTQHNMAVEDVKVGDASQDSARKYDPAPIGTDWFNRLVDGLNRLPRPMFALWVFGLLTGIIKPSVELNTMNPILFNICWTVIGFYFGVRTISQDLPKMVSAWLEMREKIKQKIE